MRIDNSLSLDWNNETSVMDVRVEDFNESVQPMQSIRTALDDSGLFRTDPDVVVTITCHARWEVLACCEVELNDQNHLNEVVTFTGSPNHAQAASCVDYMKQTWPETGDAMMEAFRQAIIKKPHKEKKSFSPQHSLEMTLVPAVPAARKLEWAEIVISGSRSKLIETLQQLTWLAATFRKPESQGRTVSLSYAKFISRLPPPPKDSIPTFDLTLEHLKPAPFEAGIPGSCWVRLLRGSVLACGFPIRLREDNVLGLEISFQLMTHLASVHYPVERDKGIVLQGRRQHNSEASSMLIPTKRVNHSIQWHFLEIKSDHSALVPEDVSVWEDMRNPDSWFQTTDMVELAGSCTFLGYCEAVKVRIGTRNFHRQIQPSGLPEASGDKIRRTSFSVKLRDTFAGVWANLLDSMPENLCIRNKQSAIISNTQLPLRQVRQRAAWLPLGSEPKNVIRNKQKKIISNTQPPLRPLFGNEPDGLIIRNEQSMIISNTQLPLRPLFGIRPKNLLIRNEQSMIIPDTQLTRDEALERAAKQPLLLYDCGERRAWLVSELSVALQMTHNYLDNEEFIWPEIRQRLEYAAEADNGGYAALHAIRQCDEVKLPRSRNFGDTVRSFLDLIEGRKIASFSRRARGWDFTDLQNSNFLFREKELMGSDKPDQSWWDLTKNDSILVLFGKNFGQVIMPDRSKIRVCNYWAEVPEGKGLLTASMHCLATLAADTSDKCWKLEPGLYWDRPDDLTLFKECQKADSCSPMQNLGPERTKASKGNCSPATPRPKGAVIFGKLPEVQERCKVRKRCKPLEKKWERKDEIQWSLIIYTVLLLVMYLFFVEF